MHPLENGCLSLWQHCRRTTKAQSFQTYFLPRQQRDFEQQQQQLHFLQTVSNDDELQFFTHVE
jgi:hypothetical protein